MTQPDSYNTGRVALSELSPRLEQFEGLAASLFSGHNTLEDTPWAKPDPQTAPAAHDGLKLWCLKRWPDVRASAAHHLAEAKRRVMS